MTPPKARTLYHFTSPAHLPMILTAGQLGGSDPMVSKHRNTGSRVVWLVDDPDPADGLHGLAHPAHIYGERLGDELNRNRMRFTVHLRAGVDGDLERERRWNRQTVVSHWWSVACRTMARRACA